MMSVGGAGLAEQAHGNSDTKATAMVQAVELAHISAAVKEMRDEMRDEMRATNMRIDGLRADIATHWPICEAHRERLDDIERRMGEAERHVENLNTLQKGWASVNTLLALIAGAVGIKQ